MSDKRQEIAAVIDQLCDARALLDHQRAEIGELRKSLEKVARERNETIQAVNTLRDQPSGEVWVKQELGREGEWFPAVSVGPDGESRYSNAATLDRAIGWFWRNTFEAFVGRSDYELPACRLINIRTGHTIPLTMRAVPSGAR